MVSLTIAVTATMLAQDSAAFAPNIEVQTLGDTAVTRGREALERDTREWFKKAPHVPAQLIARLIQGAYVADHERVKQLIRKPLGSTTSTGGQRTC